MQNDISIVPKTTNVKRMKENLAIFDFELTDDVIRQISTLNEKKTLSPWTEKWKWSITGKSPVDTGDK